MICSGVATCFGKMKLAARNGNYKLKKKSQLFIEFPGTWFDNLKVVERIKSECLLKIFILLPVELCVGVGRTTPPPPNSYCSSYPHEDKRIELYCIFIFVVGRFSPFL